MTYTRTATPPLEAGLVAVQRQESELKRLYIEARNLGVTIKQVRQRNANIEAKLAEETDRLKDKQARLAQALADLKQAQKEADKTAEEAEDQAALIRELAHDQARALAERAYRTAYQRGKDEARAMHAVLNKYGPRK